MKLADGFITHETDGQQLMVATGRNQFSGLVRSNRTAAFIIDCLKQDTTPDDIKAKVFEKYDAPMDRISADVDAILEQLRSIGAIE